MPKSPHPADILPFALAPDICKGCHRFDASKVACCDRGALTEAPCSIYKPDNFYYDAAKKKFWCHFWEPASV